MVDSVNFIVAPLLLAGFGLPAAFAPRVRQATLAFRSSLAFMAGVVASVVWATTLSTFGLRWSLVSVVLPLGILSIAGALLASRRGERVEREASSGWDAAAWMVAVGAVGHLALMAATSKSTSIDFFYFWGAKAVRFAEAGGIDSSYLTSPFAAHTHVPYPPLVPLVDAWGVELVGRLPWHGGIVSVAVWLALAFPVVLRGLRSRLPAGEATLAAGVWVTALSIALASSYSGGNAEAPLLFFTTVAVVALLAREDAFPRWVAPVAASGIVLTKSEGIVLWGLLVAGIVARDLLTRRPVREIVSDRAALVLFPALALASWVAFLVRHDLPLSDAARESVGHISLANLGPALVESLRYLEAGSGWIAWGVAALVLGFSWRRWKSVLPALAVALGVLVFLVVYYLHFQGPSLGDWVRWTLPRVSLSALSAALLGAAVAAGSSDDEVTAMTPSG